jgi:transcriptional regulator with XRE-family HTH domain
MDDKLAKTIGTAARFARQAQGLTQEDAADAVGVSSEFYARIERGRTLPSTPTLASIASALNVSADVLLGLEDLPSRKRTPITIEDRSAKLVIRRLRDARPSTVRLVNLLLHEVDTSTRAQAKTKRK